ncbi:LPS export ABC transporter permease LptF [Moraxella sp. VT-16-12]|uniref:LPS export ABC transporter permease LptF n=1 Tax=Moraxella sp. VT-16-12 TaxID=2014877 RepID=UPI0021040E92|nr:LPS export ABC transporter permease LptF [Moraxella sp. VT-16-12]
MILRRYMINQVAMTTALVLGFLVVMLLGGRLIRYFGIAAEGGLDVGVLWTLIGYNLPYFLELILPLSFFIGLMLVFGRMYADHEMAVLNAGGISRGALSRQILPLVMIVFIIHGLIVLVGKPWGVAKATNLWQEQSVVEIFELIRPKQFISSGDYHLYVGEVGENKDYLKDVIVISMNGKGSLIETPAKKDNVDDISGTQTTDLTDKIPKAFISQKDAIIYAKSATQVDSDDGVVRLDLHEGRRYEVDSQTREYSQVGFGRYRISLVANTDKDPKSMKIEGVPTTELFVRTDDDAYAELGYRLSLPFLILIAVLLATPLATVRPRQGRWLKLIPAIFIFVANVLILISLKETISKGKIGVWVYPVAVLAMMMFAVYLNYHEHLMARLRLSAHTQADKATGAM